MGWDDVPALPAATEPGDDRGLAALAGAGLAPQAEQPGPPRDRGEHEVAQIWAQVLDITAPDRATPFATLGGDALLAVRMLARLADRTDVRVPLLVFLAAPTVAGLTRAVESAGG